MDIRGLVLINSIRAGGTQDFPFPVAPALLDVAGKTPFERTVERLRQFGVSQICAIIEGRDTPGWVGNGSEMLRHVAVTRQRFWRVAENTFNEMAQKGAELVIVLRMGPYAEIDFEPLVQFHLERACRVSQVRHSSANTEIFCISASRRNDAATLFRSQLARCRSECPCVEYKGYVNPLATTADLRQFAIDILTLKTETPPAGEEEKPGVWIAPGAQVEKGARLLAPAFIGRLAKVRFGAVITRCSSVEHHSEVDCGTVVENSSILPHSYVGAGLDLAHSVVGMGEVANLRRGAVVRIADGKLIGHTVLKSGRTLLGTAAGIVTFLPVRIWKALSAKARAPRPDVGLRQPQPALNKTTGLQPSGRSTKTADEFAGNLAVARRYGNE